MREKPIIFNTDMVKVILKGRKTQTRRIVRPANPFRNKERYCQGNGLWVDGYTSTDKPNGHVKDYSVSSCWWPKESYIKKYAPYKVGDILWVRETWAQTWTPDSSDIGFIYKADGKPARFPYWGNEKQCKDEVWIPSIHMPRSAARIFLKVTDVRVERLQEIKEDWSNFEKEGIKEEHGFRSEMHRDFIKIWNSTIKKKYLDSYGWEANPWVWVIEFERVEGLK